MPPKSAGGGLWYTHDSDDIERHLKCCKAFRLVAAPNPPGSLALRPSSCRIVCCDGGNEWWWGDVTTTVTTHVPYYRIYSNDRWCGRFYCLSGRRIRTRLVPCCHLECATVPPLFHRRHSSVDSVVIIYTISRIRAINFSLFFYYKIYNKI